MADDEAKKPENELIILGVQKYKTKSKMKKYITLQGVGVGLMTLMTTLQFLYGNFEELSLMNESLRNSVMSAGLTIVNIGLLINLILLKIGVNAGINRIREALLAYGISLDEEIAKSEGKKL